MKMCLTPEERLFEVKGGPGSGPHPGTGRRRSGTTLVETALALHRLGYSIDFHTARHDAGVTSYIITHHTSGNTQRVSARDITNMINKRR